MARASRQAPNVNAAAAWMARHQQVSESALAVTFAEMQNDRWRYNVDEGWWLQWVSTHWARRQTGEMLDSVRHFLTEFSKGLKRADIITKAEAIKFQSQRAVAAVEKLCRSLPSFMARSVLFDADPFLLGTPGGTVDLRTGEMTPARPEDYVTMLTTVTPAPPGTPCPPQWQAFMDEVMAGNRDLQRTMQQWSGIGASGSARDQMMMFIYGSGRNGKGVFTRTVAGLLGDHVAGAPRDLFMEQGGYAQHPTALVGVVLARMVLASEIPEGAAWDTALIKDITGGDAMEVRRMRQDFFKVVPRCTVTIMGQHRPELKTVDESVRARFLVVTFPVTIPLERRVPDLEKKFVAEEGPEILRWMIDGAVDRELSGRLFVAQAIVDDTADYFAEENVMEDFIRVKFERAPAGTDAADPAWRVATGDAYQVWRDYCAQLGRKPGARNPFTLAMKAAGVEYHRLTDGRYFVNIRKVLGYS